jgi:hypothetical protein
MHTKNTQSTQKVQKKHNQNAKNDISVLTEKFPGRGGSDIVLVRGFHHIGYPRYYRDILESITILAYIV